MASLVQDVWIGFEPRVRARRLGPWQEPSVRLLFQLDAGETLEDPAIAGFLEGLANTIEVLAWEPRRRGPDGRQGPLEAELADARRLGAEGTRAFGQLPVLLGGHGTGAWIALAAAAAGGVIGAVAIAPAVSEWGPETARFEGPLAAALATPPAIPVLLLEARERPAAESRRVGQWLAGAASATHVLASGSDAELLGPPWPAVVAAWASALVRR